MKKIRQIPIFDTGQIVYLNAPAQTSLQLNSRKIRMTYIGPLYVKEVLDNKHVILATLEHEVLTGIYHVSRLKHGYIRPSAGNVTNVCQIPGATPTKTDKINSNATKTTDEGTDYEIHKVRFKQGHFEALLDFSGTPCWVSASQHPDLGEVAHLWIENTHIRSVGSCHKFLKLRGHFHM
jgi:hypothetical protein